MINLYEKKTEKVKPSHKNLSYTALFYRNTALKLIKSCSEMNMKEYPFQVQINLMKNMTSTQASCSRSGHNTPQRRPSGQQTPNRSRHQSGLQTPVSSYLYDTSSRSSMGEEGQLKNRTIELLCLGQLSNIMDNSHISLV